MRGLNSIYGEFARECLPRFGHGDNLCPLCQAGPDEFSHLFVDCLFTSVGGVERITMEDLGRRPSSDPSP